MKVSDLVRFKEEAFFSGAVEINWLYDAERSRDAADHFVFHGPNYASREDEEGATLTDTATFFKYVVDVCRDNSDSSVARRLLLAIGGYGSGKSHLGLMLGHYLMSGEPERRHIEENLAKTGEVMSPLTERVLVVPMNGIQNFHLAIQLLKNVRKSLEISGYSHESFDRLGARFEIARRFVDDHVYQLKDAFLDGLKGFTEDLPDTEEALSDFLKNEVETDPRIYEVVNKVFSSVNGYIIPQDAGIDVGAVLGALSSAIRNGELPFAKVVIIFDEFGRFIEYASQNGVTAGDAGLQQLFEAVQYHPELVFLGLLQADLSTYLSRVGVGSNMPRYVGRFNGATKFQLSSNLETIFGGLIDHPNPDAFDHYVVLATSRSVVKWQRLHQHLLTWNPSLQRHSVWGSWAEFRRVIVMGCFPLHPLAVLALAKSTSFSQQRSSLTILQEAIQKVLSQTVTDELKPPFHASQFRTGMFYDELDSAEASGRLPTAWAREYFGLSIKMPNLAESRDVLFAVQLCHLLSFKFPDANEAMVALSDLTGHALEKIGKIVKDAEEEFGTLRFDPAIGRFVLSVQGVGRRDFDLIRKRHSGRAVNVPFQTLIAQSSIRQALGLERQQTPFQYGSKTWEWYVEQDLVPLEQVDEQFLRRVLHTWKASAGVERPKGRVVYAYTDHWDSEIEQHISNLSTMLSEAPIRLYPVVDHQGHLRDTLVNLWALGEFSDEEQESFKDFIRQEEISGLSRLESIWGQLTRGGVLFPRFDDEQGHRWAVKMFERVYPRAIPFPFDGFTNKNTTNSVKLAWAIGRDILAGQINYQHAQLMSKEQKNRMDALLGGSVGWGALDTTSYTLKKDPSHPAVYEAFDAIDDLLAKTERVPARNALELLKAPPYGANEISAPLLVALYIRVRYPACRIYRKTEPVSLDVWSPEAFPQQGAVAWDDVRLGWVDPTQLKEQFETLISDIMNAFDTDTAANLWVRYQSQKNSEAPDHLKTTWEMAGQKLELLAEAYQKIDKFLESTAAELAAAEEAIQRGNAGEIIKVLHRLRFGLPHIEPAKKLGAAQGHRYTAQLDKGKVLLSKAVPNWIASLECLSPVKWPDFNREHTDILEKLNELGEVGSFRALQSRLKTIESAMKNQAHIEQLRSEVDHYRDTICGPETPYHLLLDLKNRGNQLVNRLRAATIVSDPIKRDWIEAVETKRLEIAEILNEADAGVRELWDLGTTVTSEKDVRDWLKKAQTRMSLGVSAEAEVPLERAIQGLKEVLDGLAGLPESPEERIEALTALMDRWSISEVALQPVIRTLIVQQHELIGERQTEWVKNIARPILENAHRFTADEVYQARQRLNERPRTMSRPAVETYNKASDALSKRETELSLQLVISAFLRLAKEQRAACLQQLSNLLND